MIDWTTGTGRLAVRGKSLDWAVWGAPPGAGPVVVLLHEGLGCVAMWRGFPARLAALGLSVFAYSRAGYGQSDPADLPRPVDYMTREAVDVLPAVLDAIGAPGVVLLGHSDGATIAAEHAGRLCDPRLAGIVLMAPHFFTEPVGLAEIERSGARFAIPAMRQRLAQYHRDPGHTFHGWRAAWLSPGFRTWNVSAVIDRWQVPALVLQGRDDQYGTAAQVEEARRSPAPVEVLLLDRCRHAPHLEQPDAVIAAVTRFLAGLP